MALLIWGISNVPTASAQHELPEWLNVLDNDIDRSIELEAYDHARRLLEEELQRLDGERHTDRVLLLKRVQQLAIVNERLGNYEPAIVLRNRALKLSKNHHDRTRIQIRLAHDYLYVGRYRTAQRIYKKVASASGNKAPDLLASILVHWGDAARLDGGYKQARRLYQRATHLISKQDAKTQRLSLEVAAGEAHLALLKGRWRDAEEQIEDLVPPLESIEKNRLELLPVLLVKAETEWFAGNLIASRDIASKALEISQSTSSSSHPSIALPLLALARSLRDLGQLGAATETMERAISILQNKLPKDSPKLLDAIASLAELYLRLGRIQDGRGLLQSATNKKVRQPDGVHVRQLNALGYAYFKDTNDTSKSTKRALRATSRLDIPMLDRAITMKTLGKMERSKGHEDKALSYLQQSIDIQTRILASDHPLLADVHSELAAVYMDVGKPEKAIGHAQAAQNVLSEHNWSGKSRVWEQLARIHYARGNVQAALKDLRAAHHARTNFLYENAILGLRGLAGVIKEGREAASFAIAISVSTPENTDARALAYELTLSQKGHALDIARQESLYLQRNTNIDTRERLFEWLAMRRRLAVDSSLSPNERTTLRRDIYECERFLQGIRNDAPNAKKKYPPPVRLEFVQSALDSEAALVEFASYEPLSKPTGRRSPATRYAAFVIVGATGPLLLYDIEDGAKVDKLVAELRFAIGECPRRIDVPEDVSCNYRIPATSLHDILFRSIVRSLGKVRDVYIAPDGALHLLPFIVLRDERGDLLEHGYIFTYLTSGRDILRKYRNGPSTSLKVFAPANDESPLEGARSEAEEVSALFSLHTPYIGKTATTERLMRLRGPGVLHITGHGWFANKKENNLDLDHSLLSSGIGFSDGGLSALELIGLDLWGTQLVVLSSCESGLGMVVPGEVVHGIRRSLLMAGAETLVTSLWSINDSISRDLIVNYYKRLLSGQDRSLALHRAMKSVKRRLPHPIYWAPFISIGRRSRLVTTPIGTNLDKHRSFTE